jgi:hypothetical protein
MQDQGTKEYLKSKFFKNDFTNLFEQDQQRFDKPAGWNKKRMMDSPLITNWHTTWQAIQNVYLRELPDLAYKKIPSVEEIEDSMEELLGWI